MTTPKLFLGMMPPVYASRDFLEMPKDGEQVVGGKRLPVQESYKLDTVDIPPGLFQEVRKDLSKYAPIRVTRAALRKQAHAYVGVVDSGGQPYYCAFGSTGLVLRVATDVEKAWALFDEMMDDERRSALQTRRSASSDMSVVKGSEMPNFGVPLYIDDDIAKAGMTACPFGGGALCKQHGGDGAKKHKYGYVHPVSGIPTLHKTKDEAPKGTYTFNAAHKFGADDSDAADAFNTLKKKGATQSHEDVHSTLKNWMKGKYEGDTHGAAHELMHYLIGSGAVSKISHEEKPKGFVPTKASKVKNVAPSSGSEKAEEGDKSKDDDAVFSAVSELTTQEGKGSLLSIRRLRAMRQLSKERFDQAMLRLQASKRVVLHHHDFPQSLSAGDRDQLVQDDRGVHYVGAALPHKSSPVSNTAGDKKQSPAIADDSRKEKRFKKEFADAYKDAVQHSAFNSVSFAEMRRRMSGYSRAEFDKLVDGLREDNRAFFEIFEGRHGKLTQEEKDAQFHEKMPVSTTYPTGSRPYAYVSMPEYEHHADAAGRKRRAEAVAKRTSMVIPTRNSTDDEIKEFAGKVNAAVKSAPKDARYSDYKVFVSELFEHMGRPGGDLDRFKTGLAEANRSGHLALARADLVGAMDPKKVRGSEISHHGAEFHFVIDHDKAGFAKPKVREKEPAKPEPKLSSHVSEKKVEAAGGKLSDNAVETAVALLAHAKQQQKTQGSEHHDSWQAVIDRLDSLVYGVRQAKKQGREIPSLEAAHQAVHAKRGSADTATHALDKLLRVLEA